MRGTSPVPILKNLLTEGIYVFVMKIFAMYYCNVIYFSSLFKINPMEFVLPSANYILLVHHYIQHSSNIRIAVHMEASWRSQSVGFPCIHALDITELEELAVKTKRN